MFGGHFECFSVRNRRCTIQNWIPHTQKPLYTKNLKSNMKFHTPTDFSVSEPGYLLHCEKLNIKEKSYGKTIFLKTKLRRVTYGKARAEHS